MSITDALLSGNAPDPELTRKFFSLRKEIEDQFDESELKEYKKIDANKEVFISKQHFQMFVEDLNFVQSKQPDIVIELNSKKYKHLFYSDCFNFTEHIKDIKKHFEGFKHTIKYKTYEG